MKTVGDLINALRELDEDMPIMAQHQPTYPLREFIGGLWVDDGVDHSEDGQICEKCDRVTLGDPEKVSALEVQGSEPDDEYWGRKCFRCGEWTEVAPPKPTEEKVAYIVLNGQPYDSTPYGDRRAWEECSW